MFLKKKRKQQLRRQRLFDLPPMVWLGRCIHRRRSSGPAAVMQAQRSRKMRTISLSLVLFAGLVGGVGGGTWLLYHHLVHSDIFRITSIQVEGNRVLRRQQVLEIAAVEEGDNLLALDNRSMAERLAQHRWVARAKVSRKLPSTLVIRLREEQPLALVRRGEGQESRLFYLNRQGVLFAPVPAGADLDFPVISGDLKAAGLVDNRFVAHSLGMEAVSFLALAAAGNPVLPIQAVSELYCSPARGLVLYLLDQPFPIYLGHGHMREKYSRLVKIIDHLYRRDRVEDLARIDMEYQRRVRSGTGRLVDRVLIVRK